MQRISLQRRLVALAAVLVSIAAVAPSTLSVANASTTVTEYVFNPSPIGTHIPPSTQVTVTVTAESGTVPVPHAGIYLGYLQTLGGGTAFVGTTPLRTKLALFTADGLGQVKITYTTPPTMPTSGTDDIRADNAKTVALSTVKDDDFYSYSQIASIALTPKPIARTASLPANKTVPLTVTAFNTRGQRAANVNLYCSVEMAAGGGTASVNGVTLSETPRPFKTDANGNITVTYTTPSTLPATGIDKVLVSDSAGTSRIGTSDSYKYK